MAEAPKFRRKQFLINRKLQLTVIAFNGGLALICIVLMILQSLYSNAIFVSPEFQEFMRGSAIMDEINAAQNNAAFLMLLTSIIILVVMVVGGLVLSNRIAGPIFSLKRHIDGVLSGQRQGDLKVRDHDFFKDMVDSYNELLKKLR